VQALLCIEENMFDISEYVVGIICGEMLEVSRRHTQSGWAEARARGC
jgi:hypothetical protein